MRRVVPRFAFVVSALAVVGALSPASAETSRRAADASSRPVDVRSAATTPSRDYVPGEVIVRFKDGAGRPARAGVRAAAGARVAETIPGASTQVLALPRDLSVERAIGQLADDPHVASVEPNYFLYPVGLPAGEPNDTEWDDLWGFSNTGQSHVTSDGGAMTGKSGADGGILDAWSVTEGSPDTVIGVIDSGVDVDHPDLAENIWTNPGESGSGKETDGIDNDDNGYVDDVHGWDFAKNDDVLLDSHEDGVLPGQVWGTAHGTHVAGTIAAVGRNHEGVIGVCPDCKVMVLKFMRPFDTDGRNGVDSMLGTTAAELQAIAYAKKMGADIVNGSYGGSGYSVAQRKALAGLKKKDVLGVFAAGNASSDNDLNVSAGGDVLSPLYPSSYDIPGIISVAASNHNDEYGYGSACAFGSLTKGYCSMTNFGRDSVDVAAPGIDIRSTVPIWGPGDDGYDTYNGTSMATPFTAGIAGLLESSNPSLTPSQIKNALMNSVDTPKTFNRVHSLPLVGDSDQGWKGRWTMADGRVNAGSALGALTRSSFPRTDGNIRGAVPLQPSQRDRIRWGGDPNDVYKKKLVKGNTYRAAIKGPDLAGVERNYSLDLFAWAPGTKDIWQPGKLVDASFGWGTKDANDEVVKFTATKNGTYYVHVSTFLSLGYDYRLIFEKV
jgi:subtilisin family serine protease